MGTVLVLNLGFPNLKFWGDLELAYWEYLWTLDLNSLRFLPSMILNFLLGWFIWSIEWYLELYLWPAPRETFLGSISAIDLSKSLSNSFRPNFISGLEKFLLLLFLSEESKMLWYWYSPSLLNSRLLDSGNSRLFTGWGLLIFLNWFPILNLLLIRSKLFVFGCNEVFLEFSRLF